MAVTLAVRQRSWIDALVHNGVYLAPGAAQSLVVRLTDGKVNVLTASSGVEVEPFYVDQDDVWTRFLKPGANPGIQFAKAHIDW